MAETQIAEHQIRGGVDRSRAEHNLLVQTAAQLAAGWAASGRIMSAKDAVAEAQKIIEEAGRVRLRG